MGLELASAEGHRSFGRVALVDREGPGDLVGLEVQGDPRVLAVLVHPPCDRCR